MRELSNSTLALLVVLAIVISAFGTFMSLSRLDEVGSGLTGFATSVTGRANLTVSSTASISIEDSEIDLGTIALNATNLSGNAAAEVDDWWQIRNIGGVNVSLDVYTAAGGTGAGTYATDRGWGPFTTSSTDPSGCFDNTRVLHQCFLVKCNTTQSGFSCNNTYYPLQNASGQWTLLRDLTYTSLGSNTDAWFGASATVPVGEGSGEKIQFVTFAAAFDP